MQLIPHLPEVQYRILHLIPMEDFERKNIAMLDLEMLPYTLSAAYSAALNVVRIQDRIVTSVADSDLHDGIMGLGQDQQREVGFAIDSFLESARRAQNALSPYLSRAFSVSLSSSLSDVVSKLGKNKVKLHPVITELLLGYWNDYGKKLKQYRDISQHHSLVTSDARVFKSIEGNRCLYLLFPSNPEHKSTSQLVYGSPPVHAIPYIEKQLLKLLSISYWLTRLILHLVPGKTGQIVSPLLRGPLFLGAHTQMNGHRIIRVEEIESHVNTCIDQAKIKYENIILRMLEAHV